MANSILEYHWLSVLAMKSGVISIKANICVFYEESGSNTFKQLEIILFFLEASFPKGKQPLACLMGCAFSVYLAKDHHTFASVVMLIFWFVTFMEMKKIIKSACLWSRTEAVTACFMVKLLERKQLHVSLMVPPLYGRPPDFWRRSCFFTGSWPVSYLLSHFCSSFIILSN